MSTQLALGLVVMIIAETVAMATDFPNICWKRRLEGNCDGSTEITVTVKYNCSTTSRTGNGTSIVFSSVNNAEWNQYAGWPDDSTDGCLDSVWMVTLQQKPHQSKICNCVTICSSECKDSCTCGQE